MVVIRAALLLIASGLVHASDIADAVMNQNADAVRSSLNHKADVNAVQPDGTTALHWAARWDDLETAQLLVRSGADPKAANHDGATPMFLAAQNGSAAMIDLLLKAGADVNAAVLAHGETAFDDGVAQRQLRRREDAAGSRSADRRQGHFARNYGADVGRRTRPRGRGGNASRAWGRLARAIRSASARSSAGAWDMLLRKTRAVPTRPLRAA